MDNSTIKSLGFWIGLGLCLLIILLPTPDGLSVQAKHVAAITVLMMIWWFSETIPVYATAFVPLALFPVLADIPASSLATFACSFAFMLPIATGPNMVIFGSERVSIAEMARCGFWLNLICIVLLTALLYFLIIPVWGIGVELPAWAF